MDLRDERHQVPLYLGALAAGWALGLTVPGADAFARTATTPVLVVLLWATFLAVPAARIGAALRNGRFFAWLALANGLCAPVAVFLLTRPLGDNPQLVVGIALVLLAPCVDYVVSFTRLAGGDAAQLLAATPLLLLIQLLALAPAMWLVAGDAARDAVDPVSLMTAFCVFIVVPLAAAWPIQWLARGNASARRVEAAADRWMPALMVATLVVVAAAGARLLVEHSRAVALAVPVYAGYVVIQYLVVGLAVRRARLATGARRAVVMSAITRNSLVVLPLAYAMGDGFALVPVVVTAQTATELVLLVLAIRAVPWLLPDPGDGVSGVRRAKTRG